jgi:hypothetical protein
MNCSIGNSYGIIGHPGISSLIMDVCCSLSNQRSLYTVIATKGSLPSTTAPGYVRAPLAKARKAHQHRQEPPHAGRPGRAQGVAQHPATASADAASPRKGPAALPPTRTEPAASCAAHPGPRQPRVGTLAWEAPTSTHAPRRPGAQPALAPQSVAATSASTPSCHAFPYRRVPLYN